LKFYFSDDEGSDEDEDELDDDDDDEEDNDEDYHEAEEEQQQQNGFQFGTSTSISSKPEVVSGLSSMMAKFDFNVNSSFNFGLQSTTEVIYINSLILF